VLADVREERLPAAPIANAEASGVRTPWRPTM
jgi:hypothetical protein